MADLPLICPYCTQVNDTHIAPSSPDGSPEPGDFWVCWCCGNAGVYDRFNGALLMRLPTEKEAAEIKADRDKFVNVMEGSATPLSAVAKLREKD